MKPIYKRIVVKVSGEALGDENDKTIVNKARTAICLWSRTVS